MTGKANGDDDDSGEIVRWGEGEAVSAIRGNLQKSAAKNKKVLFSLLFGDSKWCFQ
jgi:hypothetical protein